MLRGVSRVICMTYRTFVESDLLYTDSAHAITAGYDIDQCLPVLLPAGAISAMLAVVQIDGTTFFDGNSADDRGGGYVGVWVMLAT